MGGVGAVLTAALLGALAWLLGGVERQVVRSGFRTIETGRVRLDPGSTWVDRRWESELAHRLAALGPLDAEDVAGREALRAEVAALSFVAELGPLEVLWPDGLRMAVRFRNPVACVHVGDGYLLVADDGVVLSGLRDAPPRIGAGWLPVLGPPGSIVTGLAPGDRIEDGGLLDALSIAVSMAVHLAPEDQRYLGRVRIDATHAARTSPDEPGARLYLEGGREVWFGRSPRQGEPGSLPPELKWAHVSRALGLLRDRFERSDWELVDVRWDRPEMKLFHSVAVERSERQED